MLEDRDRLSHLDNLEEVREIQRLCGWSTFIGYLQAIERDVCPDKQLRSVLKLARSIAAKADARFLGDEEKQDQRPCRRQPVSRKIRNRK